MIEFNSANNINQLSGNADMINAFANLAYAATNTATHQFNETLLRDSLQLLQQRRLKMVGEQGESPFFMSNFLQNTNPSAHLFNLQNAFFSQFSPFNNQSYYNNDAFMKSFSYINTNHVEQTAKADLENGKECERSEKGFSWKKRKIDEVDQQKSKDEVNDECSEEKTDYSRYDCSNYEFDGNRLVKKQKVDENKGENHKDVSNASYHSKIIMNIENLNNKIKNEMLEYERKRNNMLKASNSEKPATTNISNECHKKSFLIDDILGFHHNDSRDKEAVTIKSEEVIQEKKLKKSDKPTSNDVDKQSQQGKDQKLLPAWVYCTRYSDRPSAGPRQKRRKLSRDKSNSSRGTSASNSFKISSNNSFNSTESSSKKFSSSTSTSSLSSNASFSPNDSTKIPKNEPKKDSKVLISNENTENSFDENESSFHVDEEYENDSNASHSNGKRPRTAFTNSQLARLKVEFDKCKYLTGEKRQYLANELNLNESQIKIWFQNKRAKIKKSSGVKNPLAVQLMEQGLYNHSINKKDLE